MRSTVCSIQSRGLMARHKLIPGTFPTARALEIQPMQPTPAWGDGHQCDQQFWLQRSRADPVAWRARDDCKCRSELFDLEWHGPDLVKRANLFHNQQFFHQ